MFAFVAGLIHRSGVVGVFVLMLLENLVPLIPSELILPMAGFEAAAGSIHLGEALAAATFGSILGGAAWYRVGRAIGDGPLKRLSDRHARWLTLSPHELVRAEAWFRRWGGPAVCIGRALPAVRGVICIPAGMAAMPFLSFLLWSSLGAFAWSTLLIAGGYLLRARYVEVGHWLNPVSNLFLAVSVVSYVIRVATFRPRP